MATAKERLFELRDEDPEKSYASALRQLEEEGFNKDEIRQITLDDYKGRQPVRPATTKMPEDIDILKAYFPTGGGTEAEQEAEAQRRHEAIQYPYADAERAVALGPDMVARRTAQEALDEDKSPLGSVLFTRLKEETVGEMEESLKELEKMAPNLIDAYSTATTKAEYEAKEATPAKVAAYKRAVASSNPRARSAAQPVLSYEDWRSKVLTSPDHALLRRLYDLRKQKAQKEQGLKVGDRIESLTMASLRHLGLAGSAVMGGWEAAFKQAQDISDDVAEMAGYEDTSDFLVQEIGLDKNVADAVLVQPVLTSEGEEVSAGQEIEYALARHIGEGFGMIRGLSDLGLKGDYLFLGKDTEDESLGVLQVAGGSVGGLIELALPITFGVAGTLSRGAKYSRAIKQAKAAGLYTPEVGAAAKSAFVDETTQAFVGSIANAPRILAAPIDGAGKLIMGKDMQLGKKIVEASGANIPVKDVRNVMVAEFSTNPVNRGVAQRHVALISESVRTGAKGADDVRAVAARQGLNWDTHIDELKSIGLDYSKATDLDKAIKGWGKEIIDVERIAATRAIQLGDAAPAGVKAFLTGKDSPFAALINSARKGTATRAVRTNSEADKIRAESFLMQTGSKKIAEAMKEGRWDTGRIERVNAAMFASPEAKAAAISKVKEGAVGKVQSRLGAEDSISLSAEEADSLLDYFVFNFTGAPRSRVGVKATIEEMPHMASTKQVLQNIVDGKNNVSAQDILSLRADATTIELAGRGTTVKSVDEAIAGLGGQGAIEKALSPFRALKGGGYQKQAYIDLFKPEELRRGVIRKYFSMLFEPLRERIRPQSWRGSAVEEVGSYVRGRFSAAQEEFKSNIRKTKTQVNPATGKKYTHEEAASKVVFDEWTKGEVLNETRAHESIFTDFVSGMFGGIEAITDAIQTSKGEAVLDASALDPKSIMALVEGLAETIPELKEFRSAFVQLMRMGRPDQAKMALQATALFFEGKPISSLITKEAFLSRLKASGRNVVEESLMSVDDLETSFGRMMHVETVYAAKEADSVLFFTWANKRTGNILDEAFRMLKDRKGYLPNKTTALLKAEMDLPFRSHVLFGSQTPPVSGWMKHHLELTRRSVLKGAAEEIRASTGITEANKQWNAAAARAAKAWVDNGYAGSVADAIKEIEAAYITHHKTPWKDWQKITQGEKRQDGTQLFDEQLSWMLDDMYKAATRDSEGIVRRTRGGVESIMDLPLIFSETAALKTELMDAINLTRTSELMAETRRTGGKSVVIWEGKETSPGWISGEIGKRTDQIKATDASTTEGKRLVEELRREVAALRAALPPSPRLNISGIQNLPPAARPLAFLAHATERLVEASDAFKNSGHAVGLGGVLTGLAHEGAKYAGSSFKKTWRGQGAAARLAKQGVLGGSVAPIIRYHMGNYVTGPAIVYATVGGKYVTAFSPDAAAAVAHASGFVSSMGHKVVATSPSTGKVYTVERISELISGTSITRGQASAEMGDDFAKAFKKWVDMGQTSSAKKLWKKVVKEGAESTRWIDKHFEGASTKVRDSWKWVRRHLLTTDMNIWQEVANASDSHFRTHAFIVAIKEGRTEAEALEIARKAMYDYNNLTGLEKKVFNRFMWFWIFQRNSVATVIKTVLENPKRAGVLAKVTRGLPHDDYVADKEYNQNRPFIKMVNDKEIGKMWAMHGPGIPYGSGVTFMVEALSALSPLVDDTKPLHHSLLDSLENATVVAANRARPGIKATVGVTLGKEVRFGKVQELSDWVDPNTAYMLSLTPSIGGRGTLWDEYRRLVLLEPIEPDKLSEKYTTFDGVAYKIKTDNGKRWNLLLQHAALSAGQQRWVKDYAPMVLQARKAMGKEEERTKYQRTSISLGVGGILNSILVNTGIVRAQEVLSGAERERLDLEARIREADARKDE